MSVDKFKFVSPGVFTNEVDESGVRKQPEGIGPVVVGTSVRGPSMRAVKVRDYEEFVQIFGQPSPGIVNGDVWRSGMPTAPTYGAYAAQAYLKNSGPLTFIKLAGYLNENASSGTPGWSKDKAYGLFVMPISASSTDVYTTAAGGATASLAAVIYTDSGIGTVGLIGKPLSGSTEGSAATGAFVRNVAGSTSPEFKIVLDGKTKIVNFDDGSKKYIRTVLNTSPVLTSNSNYSDRTEKYFLGPTFKTWLDKNSVNGTNFAAVLVPLASTQGALSNFELQAQDAESGWVVSQHTNLDTGSFVATNGEYPVQKLFKFYGLTENSWTNSNIKISIQDINESNNVNVRYGTFTVAVRAMNDSDVAPQYLEVFANLTLDPTSPNYIAKIIGDKYSKWDYTKKQFIEYGNNPNNSKYIRVKMNQDVDLGITDATLLPFGFYTANRYAPQTVNATNGNIPAATLPFVNGTAITGNQVYTASFAYPQLPMLTSAANSYGSNLQSVYFGLQTNVSQTKRFNQDILDLVRVESKYNTATTASVFFSLDDVSASYSSGSIVQSVTPTWAAGNRAAGKSLTAANVTSSDGRSILLANFNKFTLPLEGGFDGLDITVRTPFSKNLLDGKTEFNNVAFNSVKVALQSVSDPESLEMNILAVPSIENESLTSTMLDICEQRGDALAIVDLVGDYVPEEAKASNTEDASVRKPNISNVLNKLKLRSLNTSYGCAFFPWVQARDASNGALVWLPPSIAALGTFSSSQAKTELWFAPAGFNRGGLSDGAAGLPVVQTATRLTSKDRDLLYAANVNPIATFPSEGIVVFGQKTLQATPSALDRINVRRLMIYVKKEISRMASTVLFDPNVEITWKRFTDLANPFLASVKSRFGLDDFKVILDKTTTTPDLVDRNIVYAKILLKPTRAIEFIGLDFVITNSGASFED